MQFVLIAYDGTDEGALERRMGVRDNHLSGISTLRRSNNFISGGAILDDNGKMIGSMVLYEFPDRAALDAMLKDEPYIKAGVWKNITIHPFRLAKHE